MKTLLTLPCLLFSLELLAVPTLQFNPATTNSDAAFTNAMLGVVQAITNDIGADKIGNMGGVGTNTAFYGATRFAADPDGTNFVTPFAVTLRTNQNFAINDSTGNNVFSIRRDRYNAGNGYEFYHHLGSVHNPVVDWEMDMASGGADAVWTINGNMHDAIGITTSGGLVTFFGINQTYYDDGGSTQFPVFDNYCRVSPARIVSQPISGNIAVVPGPAAGSGASATIEGNGGSDVACSISLNTGDSGVGAGTVLTYTFDTSPGTFYVAPVVVFSAGNAAAARDITAVYATSTTTTFTLSARTALTANTNYLWNFHIIQ